MMRTTTNSKNGKAGGNPLSSDTTSEVSMTFRTVKVTGKNDFSNITVAVDGKEILIGSAFKIKWKHVEKFNIVVDGGPNSNYRNTTYVEIYDGGKKNTDGSGKQRIFTMIGPAIDNHTSSSFSTTTTSSSKWNSFAKHVQGIWDAMEKKRIKKERKRLEEEKEQKAKELARQKRSNRNGGGGAVYGRRYQQQQFDKREKFLRANRSNISYNATATHDDDDYYYGDEHEHHQGDDGDEMLSDDGGNINAIDSVAFGQRGNSNVRGKNRKQKYDKMMDVEKIFANEDDDSVVAVATEKDKKHGDDDDDNDDDDDDATSPDHHADGDVSKNDDDAGKNLEDTTTMEVDNDDGDDGAACMSGGDKNVDEDVAAVEFDEEASDVEEDKPHPSKKKSNSTKKGRLSVDASPSPKKDAEAKCSKKRKLAKLSKKTAGAKKRGKEADDNDSSDDEDVFGTSSMFTPSSQRLVSPGTTSIRRLKRRVLDDDDDDDDDQMEGTKETKTRSLPEDEDDENDRGTKDNTPSVSTFFKPIKKVVSKSKAATADDSKTSSTKPLEKSLSSLGRNLSTPKDNEQTKTTTTKNAETETKTKTDDVLEEESDATANGDDDISLNLPPSVKTSTTKKKSQAIHSFFTPRNTKATGASSPPTNDTQSEAATVVPGSGMMSSNSPGGLTVNSDLQSGTTTPPSSKNKRWGSGMWKKKPVKKSVVDSGELEEDRIEEYGSSQSVTARTPPTSRRLELADTSMKRSLTSGKRARKKSPGKRLLPSSAADDALDLADKFKSPKLLSPIRTQLVKRSTPVRSPNNVGRSWEDRSPARALYQQQPSNDTGPSTTKWRGLKNIGNSCYMNASLQMLFSVPEFMHALSNYRDKGTNESWLIDRLIYTWKVLNADKPFAYNPRQLKAAVDQLTNKFEGLHQRDAHEFLGDLIDCIHEQDIASTEEGNVPKGVEPTQDSSLTTLTSSRPREPADEFFSLNVEVNLKCMSCGYSR